MRRIVNVMTGEETQDADFVPPPAPAVVPVVDHDAELADAIASATTLAELKAALLGTLTGAKARVGGRPKE
jgi:hypothetical protein